MQRLVRLSASLCLAAVLGAFPAAAETPAEPAGEEEFLAAVRSALEGKDREAIARLTYWEGVDAEQRRLQEERQDSIFEHPLRSLELRPLPAGYRSEFTSGGARYRINLPVERLLRIEFDGELDLEQSRLFPVGVHEGRYRIARVTKVGEVEGAPKEKQLFIGVTVPAGPEPVAYTVSCSYDAGGEELREKYEGAHSTQKVVWGSRIHWCRLWNRAEEGWVRLVLKEDLETFYESERVEPGASVSYP